MEIIHIFKPDPSNLIISKLKQIFSLQIQKTTYSTILKTFFAVFQISPYFEGTTLNKLGVF